jgi:hypothetical protein
MADLEQTLTEIKAIDQQLRIMLGVGIEDTTVPKISRDRLVAGTLRPLDGEIYGASASIYIHPDSIWMAGRRMDYGWF